MSDLTADDLVVAIPGHGLVRWGDATPEQRKAWQELLQEGSNNVAFGVEALSNIKTQGAGGKKL